MARGRKKASNSFATLKRWAILEGFLGLRRMLNLYPPFFGTGIRVTEVADDFSSIQVEIKERFYNRNYVGVHFGGSLYSMCDPWYMLMLMKQLGTEYLVWDKGATIEFLKPGRGKIRAVFEIDPTTLHEIRSAVETQRKVDFTFQCQLQDEKGNVTARISKTLYVRKAGKLNK